MIGKTRQATTDSRERFDAEAGPARGILRRAAPPGLFGHSRRAPEPGLAPWIAHYWMVDWQLPAGVAHGVETLPHPNIHLVFEAEGALVHGPQTKKFSKQLAGTARVFGVKFRAGMFRPFFPEPIQRLQGRTIPAASVFGDGVLTLADELAATGEEEAQVAAANAFFRTRIPCPDEQADLAHELVERILRQPEIGTVEELAEQAGMGLRKLQRLFREYVGVSPKWVIRRYRLHELIERCNQAEPLDWADVATELGYFDQAHLIRDFKNMLGYSPEAYRKQGLRERTT